MTKRDAPAQSAPPTRHLISTPRLLNPTVLPITETRMFDTADTPTDIPRCSCCPSELHGADYGRLACWKCEAGMYERLNEVGKYWAKLPNSALRPVGERQPGRSMSVHPGIPGNAQVINLTAGGGDTPLGKLLAVEDDWRIARGYQPRGEYGRPTEALPKVLTFLRDHLPWACGAHKNPPLLEDGSPLLPDVARLSKDLGSIVGDLKQVVTGEPKPRTMPMHCVARYDDGSVCGAEMRIGVRSLRQECPVCLAEYDRDRILLMVDAQYGAAA